jgi:hypothetical protein
MPYRITKLMLAAALAAGLLVDASIAATVRAARKSVASTMPQSGDPSLVWTAPVKVTRPAPKPNRKPRKPRPKPVVEKVPLLSLRWGVLKRDAQLSPQPTNPDTIFQIGDRLALRFKVNQDGFLYVVKNSEADDEQPLLFPDSRINGGQNFVKKNQEVVIPSNCPADYNDEKGRCWFKVTDEPDELTLIFSRDLITDLPEKIKEAKDARVKKQGILELRRDSKQDLSQMGRPKDDPYMIQVTNLNKNDNEELITVITITHARAENE